MKKIIVVMALAFGGLTTYAQDTTASAEEIATAVATTQEEFSEMAVAELPEAVTAAVAKNYPTATIDKAYVNEAQQFKLEVSLEDGTSGTLYADAEGNWIEL